MPIVWLYTTENQKDNALEVIKKYTDEYQLKTSKAEGVKEYKVIIDEESEILKAISDMEDVSKSWIARERADGFMGLPPVSSETTSTNKYQIRAGGTTINQDTEEEYTQNTNWVKLKELTGIADLNYTDEYDHYIKTQWDFRSSFNGVDAQTCIYLNGTAKGTVKTNDTDTYKTVVDIVNLGKSIPDSPKIQLYGRVDNASYHCYVKEFYFACEYEIIETEEVTTYKYE